jgi:osmotically-inducible protein OsmY
MVQRTKTDSQLQREVSDELKWDTRVDEMGIGVAADNAVITLTGMVGTWGARIAAEKAAHRVAGVLDVANDLRVRPAGSPAKTDTEIAQAVRRALEWDVFVPHQRIRTTVANGVVVLEGNVEFWSQRDDAERCVANLAGVVGVSNLIAVRPSSPEPSAERVHKAIEDALERRAEHTAKKVHVTTHDGTVVLSGEVRSWAELDAVKGAARGTPGVVDVQSRLRIET